MTLDLQPPLAGRGALWQPADIEVPSGQMLELFEVLVDRVGSEDWVRFRFLAPQIACDTGSLSFDAAQADFEVLCQQFAVPYLAEHGLSPDFIAVSLLDRPVPFGASDPDATQFVEVFRLRENICVWEGL